MFYVFARYGYEEHDFKAFDTKEKAENFILENLERNEAEGNGWYPVAVVEGKELEIKIVKRCTTVKLS